jgi:hypothetical protein
MASCCGRAFRQNNSTVKQTNNLSESMNAVLKRENEWKELPVDLLALGFYFLQHYEN